MISASTLGIERDGELVVLFSETEPAAGGRASARLIGKGEGSLATLRVAFDGTDRHVHGDWYVVPSEEIARAIVADELDEAMMARLSTPPAPRRTGTQPPEMNGKIAKLSIACAETRSSGAGKGFYTVKFIADCSGTDIVGLSESAVLFWDADAQSSRVLASARSSSFEAERMDDDSLSVWARIAPVSWASDVRALLDHSYIDTLAVVVDGGLIHRAGLRAF